MEKTLEKKVKKFVLWGAFSSKAKKGLIFLLWGAVFILTLNVFLGIKLWFWLLIAPFLAGFIFTKPPKKEGVILELGEVVPAAISAPKGHPFKSTLFINLLLCFI